MKNYIYREKRLEQERSLLTRQVDRLQQQLEQRVEESVNQRREHSTTILRLQTDLNHKLEEVNLSLLCFTLRTFF